MKARHSQSGFTLVELMVTISCMAVIAAIAVPRMTGYLLQSHLDSANAYLSQIAAKQRMYKITNGVYCCQGYGLDENTLVNTLGVNLADNGDFCFVFVCQSGTICPQTTGPGFITSTASSSTAPDFEVWAILQAYGGGSTTAGPGGAQCTPATGKVASTGFSTATSSGLAGRAGQAVAYRYPPPTNGPGSVGTYHSITFDWHDGISKSDAQFP